MSETNSTQSKSIAADAWRRKLPTPVPVPSEWHYKLERWRALISSPRRLYNYIRYLRSARRSSEIDYLPVKLDVENVSRCNFHCTMCQVSEWPKYQRAEDMSFDQFKHLIDHQYGLVELKLQGMGEPTLGGDTFFNMIRYARKKSIWVRTVTNASLLHINDNYKKLIDANPNEVQISIDGATKETFESIRRGSRFEKVVENCKLINAYCKKRNRIRTKMWVVVQRANIHELLPLVELAHEMGFKHMVLSLNLTDWGQESWSSTNASVLVEDSITPELVKQIVQRSNELGVYVGFWNITSKYSTKRAETLCPWPFERAYVSSDMKIVPCCMIANPDVADLGDARYFTEQWNSDEYQQFRKSHLEGNLPNYCKGCYEDSTSTEIKQEVAERALSV